MTDDRGAQRPKRSKTGLQKLRSVALWLTFAFALVFAAVEWLLPWLGRRGNLNAIIESILRSSLTIPVRIEKIETEPLSNFTVTRLRSVDAVATDRFELNAGSITIEYDPVELLGGKIQRIVFDRPELFVNLDSNLQGLARVPDLPRGAPSKSKAGKDAEPAGSPLLLPFEISSTSIANGSLKLKMGERVIALSALQVEHTGLGRALDQRFQASFEVLGGSVRAWGNLDVLIDPGKPTRYAFHAASIVLDGVEASRLLDWFASDSASSAWIRAASLKARGRIHLEGTIDGTWPETLTLSLATHANEVAAAYGDDLALHRASLGVRLNVTCTGDAESLKFSISTQGTGRLGVDAGGGSGGTDERAFLEVEGELRRLEADGLLEISRATLGLAGAGEVSFSGKIASLLGTGPPGFDVQVDSPAIDAQAILSRLPPSLRKGILSRPELLQASGKVRASLHILGDTAKLRGEGDVSSEDLAIPRQGSPPLHAAVKSTFTGLELDTASWSWRAELVRLESGEVSAREAADALGLAGKLRAIGGALQARVELCDPCLPLGSRGLHARGKLRWIGGSLDLEETSGGFDGLDATLDFDGAFDPSSRKLALEIEAKSTVKELLAGSLYVPLNGGEVRFAGSGSVTWDKDWRPISAEIGEAEAATPVTGPVAGSVTLLRASGGDGFAIDAAVRAPEIPASEAYRVLVGEPLGETTPFFAGSAMKGSGSIELRIEGSAAKPSCWGRATLSRSSLALKDLEVRDLELDLPFELGPRSPAEPAAREVGFLESSGVIAAGIYVGSVHVDVSLAAGTYTLEPVRLRVYGGTLDVTELELTPGGDSGLSMKARLHGKGIDAKRLTLAHGLPPITGSIRFDLEPLKLRGNRVESLGSVVLAAFGGEATFSDLTIENLSRPYSDLRLREGRLKAIRLADVGEAFHFGILSGVLEGTVSDLGFTGGELTSFEADLETVPTAGAPQFVNRSAIDSIRRIFAGPIGAIEESLFSKFRFADFGFWCRLEDGVFRLRGKYLEGETEYIMRGRWYQFPRINIINSRPDRPYDWKTIVANLRKIYKTPRGAP